ncbi:MAG: hypothetical protein HS115_07980 [Spirochaetales bacterium]|nr:hypothetical protein [Spirochaetales bacterium]
MDTNYLYLIGALAGICAFLFWMLFPIQSAVQKPAEVRKKPRCPLCHTELEKGEKLRSSVMELGNVEVRTTIKGCPYCLTEKKPRKRTCPVCRAVLSQAQALVAYSDPRQDRKSLSMRGCSLCYPQGFE